MSKIKIGEVRYAEKTDGTYGPVTVASREVYNNIDFYRTKESKAGLLLTRSLHKNPPVIEI
jgi:hypothetical protein